MEGGTREPVERSVVLKGHDGRPAYRLISKDGESVTVQQMRVAMNPPRVWITDLRRALEDVAG